MSDDRFTEDAAAPPPAPRAPKRSWRLGYEDVQAFLDKFCSKLGMPRTPAKQQRQRPAPAEKSEALDVEWDKLRGGK